MNILKLGLALGLAVITGGCAHKTPFTDGTKDNPFCHFKRYPLNLDHRNGTTEADQNIKSLSAVLTDGFTSETDRQIPKDEMLFLSGGSLNGAFGAGVLAGWSERRGCPKMTTDTDPEQTGCLPDFSVVTGVSTGAILSLAAFTNTPQSALAAYTMEDETEAILPFVRLNKKGKLSEMSYVTALRKGALADISPLQESVYSAAAKYGFFSAIAKRGEEGRLLLTGVVDVDTGEAVALDMTAMAGVITKRVYLEDKFEFRESETIADLKKRSPDIGHYVDCFTRAITASSSVPLAARPVAIDNRLYVDGGARFLVFGDVLGPIIDPEVKFTAVKDDGESDDPLDVFMIINGDQTITPKCAKKTCSGDLTGDEYWTIHGARDDWNVLGLVERTVDVLKTQVGEFSESEIRIQALRRVLQKEGIDIDETPAFSGVKSSAALHNFTAMQQTFIDTSFSNAFEGYNLHSIKIEPETIETEYGEGPDRKSCIKWREYDLVTDRNLQFHVNYMKCMIEAGREDILNKGWK